MPRSVHPRRTAGPATLLLALASLAGCAETGGPPIQSSVHEFDGQRVDVPAHDLARDGSGLLRNGLLPQPQEFD